MKKVRVNKLYKDCLKDELLTEYQDFLSEMILNGKIDLECVPFKIRSSSRNYYIYSFRRFRGHSPENYHKTLELLMNDIETSESTDQKLYLIRLYQDYMV